jgi:transposase
MFLKAHKRTKDGKRHSYYSLVQSIRTTRGPQHRTLAYLGELNGSAEAAWRKSIAVFNDAGDEYQLELFPSDEPEVPPGERVVRVVLDRVRWERPRDLGEVFLAWHLWRLLGLDRLLSELMPDGSEEVPWHIMAFVLTAARLIEPTSELATAERFYPRTALDDVTGVPMSKVNKDRLYRTLDRLLPHKEGIERHLKSELGTLFSEPFDLLLYDLTSTYFEGLSEGNPEALRGYSRDHRQDCGQIVIGLVVTRSGLPLGYEVFAGNRADSTTLTHIMARMEELHGKASRIWVFDRGVASERNLEALRVEGGHYLVGTPRTLLRKIEKRLLDRDFTEIKDGIEVKLVPAPDGSQDTFILCRSRQRREKETAIHDRFEQRMEEGLQQLQRAIGSGRLRQRDLLNQRLGRLKLECSRVARAYAIQIDGDGTTLRLSWKKDQAKAAQLRLTEGAYLLRTNLSGHSQEDLWHMYMQLNDAEAAFRTLKQDLSIRPIHHQVQDRVHAHVLVCFLAYALFRTLDRLAKAKALGLGPRRILSTLATIKSGDILLPLVDGREIRLRRVSRPDKAQADLLARLGLTLPEKLGSDALEGPNVVQT